MVVNEDCFFGGVLFEVLFDVIDGYLVFDDFSICVGFEFIGFLVWFCVVEEKEDFLFWFEDFEFGIV